TRRRSSTRSSRPRAIRRNAGRVADALRERAADTAGRRSPLASRPCTRSCLPPLPASRLRGGGARELGRLTLFSSTSRSPILRRVPGISNSGAAVLALLPDPLVVEPLDGVAGRRQPVPPPIGRLGR